MISTWKVICAALMVAAISVICVNRCGAAPQDASTSQPGVELQTPWPGNIAFTAKTPARLDLVLDNILDSPVQYGLRVTVADWYGHQNSIVDPAVSMAANVRFHQAIPIDLSRPNYYSISVVVSLGGKPVENIWRGVSVVDQPLSFGKDDPNGFFGMQSDSETPSTERLGVTWLRTNADASPDGLERIRRHHQLILATVWPFHWGGTQTDVYLGPFPDTALLDNVIRTDAPYVAAFEIQNEPDLTFGEQVHADFKTSVAYYLNDLRQVSAAIRQYAPNDRSAGLDVSGGDYADSSTDYADQLPFAKAVMQGGGGKCIDVLTCHPYAYPRGFGPGQDPVWPTDNHDTSKYASTLAMIRQFGGNQQFWVGEKGWALDVNADPLSSYSRDFARCLAQALVIAKSVPGVHRYFWYCENDGAESGYAYGVFRHGEPLPASLAYATAARMLHHAQPYLSPSRSDSVQVHCFVCPESHTGTLVLWNDSRNLASIAVAQAPGGCTAFDMMGNPIAGGIVSGRLSLQLDRSPVYVQFPAADAGCICTAIARAPASYANPLSIETAYLPDLSHIAVRLHNMDATKVVGHIEAGGRGEAVTALGAQTLTVVLPAPAHLSSASPGDIPVQVRVGARIVTLAARADLAACRRVQGIPAGSLMTPWDSRPDFVLDRRSQIEPPDSGIDWSGPDDLNANAWTGWDSSALYVSIRVHDPIQAAPDSTLAGFWNSDSVQIAIDPHNTAAPGAGYDKTDLELGMVLAPDGPRIYESAPLQKQLGIPCSIARNDAQQLTLYQVAIPWTLLGVQPESGHVIGFDFVVNQNNGNGRTYWMGLTPGIGDRKEPWDYERLYLATPAQ